MEGDREKLLKVTVTATIQCLIHAKGQLRLLAILAPQFEPFIKDLQLLETKILYELAKMLKSGHQPERKEKPEHGRNGN